MNLLRTAFLILGLTLFGGAAQAAPIDYERLDQRLETRPTHFGQMPGEEAIEPLALVIALCFDFEALFCVIGVCVAHGSESFDYG